MDSKMLTAERSLRDQTHNSLQEHFKVEEEPDALQRAVLEAIACQATTLLSPESPPASSSPSSPVYIHPKTGKIRLPRSSSVSSASSAESTSSTVPQQPISFPKLSKEKWELPENIDELGWVSTAKTMYGLNKPKCPPCHRLKKKDPCRGPPPCRECYRKGRRTAMECQEWGEGYLPKRRKVGRPRR